MLMLTLGDPISGVLGSAGPGERKALPVMAVTFVVCFVIAALVLPVLRPGAVTNTLLVGGAVGALGATLADGFKPVVAGYVIDDNATIPPAAALGVFAVVALLSG
jgi:dolichol kinase